jgi:hypothetical protein
LTLSVLIAVLLSLAAAGCGSATKSTAAKATSALVNLIGSLDQADAGRSRLPASRCQSHGRPSSSTGEWSDSAPLIAES